MNAAIELTLLQFAALQSGVIICVLVLRNKKLRLAQSRIVQLEEEMLRCHSEILALSHQRTASTAPLNDADSEPVNKGNRPGLSVAS